MIDFEYKGSIMKPITYFLKKYIYCPFYKERNDIYSIFGASSLVIVALVPTLTYRHKLHCT